MVPLKLNVKNFMCYRDNVPTLDLEGMHVACLCGDNGHGKTALLDAISWALWGQARARTQEELVHLGEQHMTVELEFMARDQRYRVTRSLTKSAGSRQAHPGLELQVASDDGFRPITGNVMRDTQRRITEILHMDYDTFVNTAFLRQGDADRFTTSRPSERKATLAEVLDLSYYDGLEEQARARSRDIQVKSTQLDVTAATSQTEIARRPQYQAELDEVTVFLGRVSSDAQSLWVTIADLSRKVDLLNRGRSEMAGVESRVEEDRKESALLKDQVRSHESRVAVYEDALRREQEIRDAFAALEAAEKELQRLNQALARKSELDGERAPAEREVAVEGERLSGQIASLRKRVVEDLRPKIARLPEVEAGFAEVSQERSMLAELEESIRLHEEESQELSATSRDLQTANDRLRQEMEDTRKKFDMLDQGDASCPLCNQPLGPDGQEHLRREYETQGIARRRQHEENSGAMRSLEPRIKELSASLPRMGVQLTEGRKGVEGKTANLERDRAESIAAEKELQASEAELKRVELTLTTEDFAREQRVVLTDLDGRVAALGYDGKAHQRAQERIKSLGPYANLHRSLVEAAERLPVERESLETTRQLLARRLEEVSGAEKRKSDLESELKALPALDSQRLEAEARHRNLGEQRERALGKQGALQQQIARCDALQKEVSQQESQRRSLQEEKALYDELAVAFGKNGIQALIIETAIPQIEDDANELLGRLTENRMFLKLQLQEGRKDSRSGLPSEELDIKIADEVGTRRYETFSGGEAFRIDFALRIALSKLLARRSGAPLPILFIDEGFGTQDSTGQERLTEAIQSIQNDFEKIIVITHIEQMKQAFPVRIEVTKTGAGSTFEVV